MFLRKLTLAAFLTLSIGAAAAADTAADNAAVDPQTDSDSVKIDGKGIQIDSHGSHIKVPTRNWEGIAIPFGVFLMIVALAWIKQQGRATDAKNRLEAIKVLADKGQPIPPDLISGNAALKATMLTGKRSPLRRAITHLGLGIGFLIYFLITDPHGGLWAIGVAFLFSGLGNIWLARNLQ